MTYTGNIYRYFFIEEEKFYDVKAKKNSPTYRNNRVSEEGILKRVDRYLMTDHFISKDARYR